MLLSDLGRKTLNRLGPIGPEGLERLFKCIERGVICQCNTLVLYMFYFSTGNYSRLRLLVFRNIMLRYV